MNQPVSSFRFFPQTSITQNLMIMKTPFTHRFGRIFGTLLAFSFLAASAPANITALNGLIENPSDGGAGPAIWLSTSGTNNTGSDSPGTAGSGGLATFTLDKSATDFFGTAGSAYALRDGATSGAGITGSGTTGYATGTNGTLVMTFQTPASLVNASLFGRGQSTSSPNFELFLLGGTSQLRLTLDSGSNTILGTIAADTWYYLAVAWDTGLASNQVSWSLGAMGDAPSGLSSGNISSTAVGNPAQSIFIAGRPGTNASNYAGAFQNIAIYDRTLSAGAIDDQFSAIPEPSTYVALLGGLALGLVLLRRRAQG
jgi:hypothetical protein